MFVEIAKARGIVLSAAETVSLRSTHSNRAIDAGGRVTVRFVGVVEMTEMPNKFQAMRLVHITIALLLIFTWEFVDRVSEAPEGVASQVATVAGIGIGSVTIIVIFMLGFVFASKDEE